MREENIKIEENDLVIRIPLKQERHSPYDDDTWKGDNIIAIIEPQSNCNFPKMGFCYRIDMSYKGKPDQWTDFFYSFFGEEKEFIELCKELNIEIFEHERCDVCKGPIYGCSTWKNGKVYCNTCSWEEEGLINKK